MEEEHKQWRSSLTSLKAMELLIRVLIIECRCGCGRGMWVLPSWNTTAVRKVPDESLPWRFWP